MYLIWKWSTLMFVLQLVIGEWMYQFFEIRVAFGVAGVATGVAAILYGAVYHKTDDLEYLTRYLSAFMATIAIVGWECSLLPAHDFASTAALCVLLVICLSATVAERIRDLTKDNMSLVLLAVTALPLGVGSLIGGSVLLRRLYHKYELVRKRQFVKEMTAQ